jgi:Putative peptidoglycan binding domain
MSSGDAISAVIGANILQLARQHLGEPYVLGVRVPKDNQNWKGPWDCAEFASWVVYQAASALYGCNRDFGDPSTADAYTGYWSRDANRLGKIVSVDESARTPGAFVLRLPQAGSTGHIVVSDGAGGTIEAHSSKDGVIRSTLDKRRWDTGILVPSIQYTPGDAVAVSPPPTKIYRLTMPVMTGDDIRKIQTKLKAAGFDPGVIDGEYGPHTQAAVIAFQISSGLAPDGEVGPKTAAVLGLQLRTAA